MILPKNSFTSNISTEEEVVANSKTTTHRRLIDYTKERRGIANPTIIVQQEERIKESALLPLENDSGFTEMMLHTIPCEIELMKSSAFDVSGLGDSFTSLSDEWKKYDKELKHQEETKEIEDNDTLINFYLKIPSKSSRRQRQKSNTSLREQYSPKRNSHNRKTLLESVLDKMILDDNL